MSSTADSKSFVKISISELCLSSPETLGFPVSPVLSLSEACAPAEGMPKFPFQGFCCCAYYLMLIEGKSSVPGVVQLFYRIVIELL